MSSGWLPKSGITFDHRAGDGRVHIRRGLDGLDHREGVAGLQSLAGLGHLDEHEIAERTLRMVGDAHFDIAIGECAHPLVRLGVLEIGGNVAHVTSPQKETEKTNQPAPGPCERRAP